MDEHGAGHAHEMLPQFEAHLESRTNGGGGSHAEDEEARDRVREGVVVLLGTLARHMDLADPKVRRSCGCFPLCRPAVALNTTLAHPVHSAVAESLIRTDRVLSTARWVCRVGNAGV